MLLTLRKDLKQKNVLVTIGPGKALYMEGESSQKDLRHHQFEAKTDRNQPKDSYKCSYQSGSCDPLQSVLNVFDAKQRRTDSICHDSFDDIVRFLEFRLPAVKKDH